MKFVLLKSGYEPVSMTVSYGHNSYTIQRNLIHPDVSISNRSFLYLNLFSLSVNYIRLIEYYLSIKLIPFILLYYSYITHQTVCFRPMYIESII